MDTFWKDLQYAVRSLAASPAFLCAAVLTLAVGIGANTTIFTVVYGVLMRPLPYPTADRLAILWHDLGKGAQSQPLVHPQDFLDYREESRLFEELAAGSAPGISDLVGILTGEGGAEYVTISTVTANFFPLLGIDPAQGRHFEPSEEVKGGPRIAIISHELWQRRYGGDPEMLDRQISIDRVPHTVVGILPAGFRLRLPAETSMLRHADVWVPIQIDYNHMPPRSVAFFTVLGRLRDGATFEQAQAEMDTIAAGLRARHQVHASSGLSIRVVPLHADVVKGARPALLTLWGAVLFVLLIMCSNVANLVLIRGAAREREIAIQLALGAGPRHIVQRLFLESFLLAAFGAVLALGLTWFGLLLLEAVKPPELPRPEEIRIDLGVVAYTAVVALGGTVLFGLIPAFQSLKLNLTEALKEGGKATSGARSGRLRGILMIGEVGLSLVLLIGLGLMIRSFSALQQIDPGFNPRGVLMFRLQLPIREYPEGSERFAFFSQVKEQVAALPGVVHVGATSLAPLSGGGFGSLTSYAYNEETTASWGDATADKRVILPGYLESMGTRLLAGRFFTEHDDTDAPRVILVDERLAHRVWPGEHPVGRRLQIQPSEAENPFAEVVGMVEHMRVHDLAREVREQIYLPYATETRDYPGLVWTVKAEGDPLNLTGPIRDLVAAIDPGVPVLYFQLLSEHVRDATAERRFNFLLMAIFAGLALVLSATGMYGVMAHSAGQRSDEFAIRLALGEAPSHLRWRLVTEGMKLLGVGLVLGLVAAAALTRFLEAMLVGVSPIDPVTFAATVLFLALVGLAAFYLPARRASRLNPATVLHTE